MNNPFEVIDEMLSSIENLILNLKHQPTKVEPTPPQEQFLTIQEAAEFLSLTVPTMYSKVSKVELPVMRRSKRLYFSRTELLNYLKDGHKKSNLDMKNEQLCTLHSVVPMLHHIAKCIDDAIENKEDNDKISEIVELMKAIAEDNWMFVR